MLKIRNDIDLEELKKYGFKLEPEHQFYYKELDSDIEIEIQRVKNDPVFKYKEIGINAEHGIYLNELDILYDLIQNNLVEKVEE